jgi:hypothetical protein
MAAEKELGEMIGRAIADPEFRARLVEDPEKAIKEAGYELTEEQLAQLKSRDLESLSTLVDERLSKTDAWFCW